MKTSPTHLPSLLGSIVFALSALFLLGIGLLMGFTAFFTFVTGEAVQVQQTILFVAFGFEALLLFAAAFFAFQKTAQKPSADQASSFSVSRGQLLIGILVAAGALLIGYQIGAVESVNWLILPFLTVPAIVLPLAVLLALGTQGLPMGTRWQTWSVFGLGMSLTPLLLFVLEIVVLIFIFFGAVVYIFVQPELIAQLQSLSRQMMILGPESEEAVNLIAPLLTQPGVMVVALIYIAVIVPLIEELLKPFGVWLLAGRLNSAAQGFTLGALSGGAYGLIETIGVSGQAGDWASLLSTRIGTGLLHITTSALMGAAIVIAWRERRYLRLLGTYLLAVLLHGLWNTFAMLFTFSTLAEMSEQPGRLSTIQPILIAVMSTLAFVLFMILLLSNRRMQKLIPPPHAEPPVSTQPVDQIP